MQKERILCKTEGRETEDTGNNDYQSKAGNELGNVDV